MRISDALRNLVQGNIARDPIEGAIQGFMIGLTLSTVRTNKMTDNDSSLPNLLMMLIPTLIGVIVGLLRNEPDTPPAPHP